MKKVVVLFLIVVLILQTGMVLAKGGKGQQQEAPGSSGPFKQKDQSGEKNQGQNGKTSDSDPADSEATLQVQEREMKQLRMRLEQEGLKLGQSSTQIEHVLQLVTRLHHEFCYRLLSGDSDEDEARLTELGKKLVALSQRDRLEEQLRELLRSGCSLEEAIDRLII